MGAVSQRALDHIRRGHHAFNQGDLSVMIELAAPDVEWGATGAFPGLADQYRGPEAIQKWADVVRGEWDEFQVELADVLHDGEDLVVVEEHLRGRGRRSGVEVEMSVYATYWLDEEDRITRRAAFTEREAALAAAGVAAG
jgi:ketosteroid isomerase-like protein